MTSSNMQPESVFDYKVIYSDRQTVGITVERDGSVVVRAPRGLGFEDIERAVASRKRWIDSKVRHPQKYQERAHAPGKEIISGESVLFCGRVYRLEVVESNSDKIEFDAGFFVPRSLGERAPAAFREWFKGQAVKRLVPRVGYWATRLGVRVADVRVSDDRFRWGSCTPAGTVSVNWRLVKAPVAVADYVIVHELAHLLEANHGDNFWSIVRSHVPKVDGSRAWLKEHGQLLEQEL